MKAAAARVTAPSATVLLTGNHAVAYGALRARPQVIRGS